MNVGRKGNLACAVKDFFPDSVEIKSYDAVAVFEDLFAFCFKFVFDESEPAAFMDFLAGSCKSLPVVIVDPLEEEQFNGTLGIRSYA